MTSLAGRLPALCLISLFFLAGCIPQDSDDTLTRLRDGGALRIGYSVHPPWVEKQGDTVSGIEPVLLRRFAEGLETRIAWVEGSEATLVEKLRRGEIDLIAAGLDSKTPWASQGGLTQPFAEAGGKRHVMLVRGGESATLYALDRMLLAARRAGEVRAGKVGR
ncbi:transporter substrate-binding domain-containing protein [Oceanibaculum pacificum]|uniref:Solute-binding protein family 3/N-terminal domain-containing protein n=1 Tax=Oceanibaculum pacificum TaxID=580166 RepID=A0A154VVL9_9PROT|nr:transporter substrate-binding domain-containing protein [Oceanibaculum pacificum]KZD05327.1 hypothetical protein AUP43_11695 [Oceanibaculum pacificum]